jgi:hypothetical protein
MGAIRPLNLRQLPFGGQASTSQIHYIGASGASVLPGGVDDRFVPSMGTSALVVTWEIINTDTTNNLYVRFGPDTGLFTVAAGQTLDNYFTLKPGVSYNFPVFDRSQQINDQKAYPDYSILLVKSSAGSCDYTGVVTVWDVSDDPT